jgi:hypothetical protein
VSRATSWDDDQSLSRMDWARFYSFAEERVTIAPLSSVNCTAVFVSRQWHDCRRFATAHDAGQSVALPTNAISSASLRDSNGTRCTPATLIFHQDDSDRTHMRGPLYLTHTTLAKNHDAYSPRTLVTSYNVDDAFSGSRQEPETQPSSRSVENHVSEIASSRQAGHVR